MTPEEENMVTWAFRLVMTEGHNSSAEPMEPPQGKKNSIPGGWTLHWGCYRTLSVVMTLSLLQSPFKKTECDICHKARDISSEEWPGSCPHRLRSWHAAGCSLSGLHVYLWLSLHFQRVWTESRYTTGPSRKTYCVCEETGLEIVTGNIRLHAVVRDTTPKVISF